MLNPTDAPSPSNEQRYFDALKRITKYMSPERIRRDAEHNDSALSYEEYLEMAYENVIQEAHRAVHGKRRPKK